MHRQIKNSPIELNACTPMVVSVQIAKFKLRQYQWRAILPNLMLAKVTRYTVYFNYCSCVEVFLQHAVMFRGLVYLFRE